MHAPLALGRRPATVIRQEAVALDLPGPHYRWVTPTLLLTADLLALALAGGLSAGGRHLLGGKYSLDLYASLWPALGLFLVAYAAIGLYTGAALSPGVGLAPVEELRRTTVATSWVYLGLGMAMFLIRGAEIYSRAVFLSGWALSILLVPLGRTLVRGLCSRRRWWGCPAVVLGAGKTGHLVVAALQRHPELGLKPVAMLDDDPGKWDDTAKVPIIGGLDLAAGLAKEFRIPYAIVAMPGVPGHELWSLYRRYGEVFPHLLVIPGLVGFSSLWVTAKDVGGVLGLEVRQRLLLRGPRFAKRVLDLGLTLLGGLLALPLIGLIALLIKLTSRGPALYGHERIGHLGRRFKAWKFRTMMQNSNRVLEAYLQHHPELRVEWNQKHKLTKDPRVTWVGRLLRKSSLDELPQFWNVLRGDMSLVGPRPIVPEEIQRYGDKFSLYTQVLPGITGLWQVSGRNNLPYEERVTLDAYYVRNWSVWMDLYILSRTTEAVLFGKGAY